MKNHSNMASRIIGILGMAVAVGWLQPTAAYGQTAENTVIANFATVTYTDANNNTYSSVVSGTVNVTVGFGAGVDVVAAQGTATPVSSSSGNTMVFTVNNIGNGIDSMTVAPTNSDATVLTVTKYTFNAADYTTLILLNEALAAWPIAAAGNVVITVEYSIEPDKGGQPSTYTLTATSRRGAATDNDNTVVTPGLTGTVATTPNGQAVTQLPSNGGTEYTFTFNVANNQNGPDDFDLLVTLSGEGVITIVSVNGVGGSSTTISLGASANQDVDVVYRVAPGAAAGATETLFLAATSVADVGINDQGSIDLTVVKASLTITKEAYRDDQTLLGGGDTVVPGEFIQYKVTVTNTGTAEASSVQVVDVLPSELTYDSATEDAPTWTFILTGGNTLTSDLTGTLAASDSRFFWIRVLVN